MLRGIQVSKIAVEESVCQWCGARIYLVRVSINNWEWVTDLKRPHAWNCYANAEPPAARLHQPVKLRERNHIERVR
jgi:hypothetical protein